MIKEMTKNSSWEHSFYKQAFLWMYRARNFPSRVILPVNSSGKFQLEVRDFGTNYHRQITKSSQGSIFGSISSSGEYVYYLDDKGGNEIGHFVREPFSGGKKVDITPNLPSYFAYEVSSDYKDERLCFYASIKEKNYVYLVETRQGKEGFKSKLLYETEDLILGTVISPDGKQTCVSISLGGKKNKSQVLVFDNNKGKLICKINFLAGDFIAQAFSVDSDKPLILGILNKDGFYRPVWFDFLKKQITEIKNPKFKGNVFVLEWLEDQNKILFGREYKLKHSLLLYDLNKKTILPIGPDYGSLDLFFGSVTSLLDGSLILRWQSFDIPPQIIKIFDHNYQKTKSLYLAKRQIRKKKLLKVWFSSLLMAHRSKCGWLGQQKSKNFILLLSTSTEVHMVLSMILFLPRLRFY
jgi:Tol biopolymer transport system component